MLVNLKTNNGITTLGYKSNQFSRQKKTKTKTKPQEAFKFKLIATSSFETALNSDSDGKRMLDVTSSNVYFFVKNITEIKQKSPRYISVEKTNLLIGSN